ncbi:hypothetical protein [Pontibacter flavimaris]|uniref:hypothetical protein n=1 Tax=Pontibacter flavimaris TaxID=1797110 RepID=UPI00111524D8|nr:hypothetical protein [Pontibacter flavimaris]
MAEAVTRQTERKNNQNLYFFILRSSGHSILWGGRFCSGTGTWERTTQRRPSITMQPKVWRAEEISCENNMP